MRLNFSKIQDIIVGGKVWKPYQFFVIVEVFGFGCNPVTVSKLAMLWLA